MLDANGNVPNSFPEGLTIRSFVLLDGTLLPNYFRYQLDLTTFDLQIRELSSSWRNTAWLVMGHRKIFVISWRVILA